MATAKAPNQLPEETTPPVSSVANEPNRDEDGFIQQESVGDHHKPKGPFLVGKSDVGTDRVVTREQFKSVGIDQDTLTFSWESEFKLALTGINPEAVQFLVDKEYGFSVVDE